jgi:tetratricopeptide (TPR) repeat protein
VGWVNKALSLWDGEKYSDMEKAIEYLNNAIKLEPGYAGAYDNRGNAYNGLKQYENAIKDFNQAILLKPDLAAAYYNRGNAYNKLGQYEHAIEDYNETIRLNPDYALAYNNRAIAYFNQGNEKQYCLDAKKACELGLCKVLEHAKGKGYCQ